MENIPQIKPDKAMLQQNQNMSNNGFQEIKFQSPQADVQQEGSVTIPRKKFKLPKFRFIKPKLSFPKGKKLKFIIAGFIAFLVLFLLLIILPGISLAKKSQKLISHKDGFQQAIASKDIKNIQSEIDSTKKDLTSFQKSLKFFVWVKPIPFVGGYYSDASAGTNAGIYGLNAAELAVKTVTPYADIIGFAGPSSEIAKSGEDTANDRIEFLVQTIEDILPQMGEISKNAENAQKEINKINSNHYPEKFRGKEVRSKIEKGISLANQISNLVIESKPLMESAPYLLGIDSTRTYMLLFQNDKELRPTGGFITAYSIAKVTNGKFEPVSSSDIYDLDNKYSPSIEAPDIFPKYIKGPYVLSNKFRLRDMNWSPDFEESMNMFSKEAENAGIKNIDGIIAVDTEVLVKILNVIGPIGVPGYGNFSTEIDSRCNCANVIYELESFADVEGPVVWSENEPGKIVFAPANYDNRKKIVGPLLNSILSNSLGQPKEKLPNLFQAFWESVNEKHLLVYLFDKKAQDGAIGANIAGKIKDYDGDYLHINDANLAGRKSNLYVTQEVTQDINVKKDGTVEKIVTLTYKNPQDYDGWLNSVLPNWTRIYVPKGSKLLEVDGFDMSQDPYEDLGKTVFAGGFELRPKGVRTITIKYQLPFKVKKDYNLLIQKQPGTGQPLYTINLGKNQQELYLTSDQEFNFKI